MLLPVSLLTILLNFPVTPLNVLVPTSIIPSVCKTVVDSAKVVALPTSSFPNEPDVPIISPLELMFPATVKGPVMPTDPVILTDPV